MKLVSVAFKAHQGWINAVAVDINSAAPTPLHAQPVELTNSHDREVLEPYHVAGGWDGLRQVPAPKDPGAIVRRGRSQQVKSAIRQLSRFKKALANADLQWARAVVLTGRGKLSDDLNHILGSHTQIHVAEGEAIRDATRAALVANNIKYSDQDEKNVLVEASQQLNLSAEECDNYMKELKPVGTKAWRKEERLIALAAWLRRI